GRRERRTSSAGCSPTCGRPWTHRDREGSADMATTTSSRPARRSKLHGREAASGWLFITPVLILLGLFLVLPVIMAAWVSLSDWTGRGSPFSPEVSFVGGQ